MRVLIDEDLNVRLRHAFHEGIEAETVQYLGWKGLDNGKLLHRAQTEYDVFVTMDTNLAHQQNIDQFDIAVFVLRARSKRLPDLEALMPEVNRRLEELRPGQVVEIYPPERG